MKSLIKIVLLISAITFVMGFVSMMVTIIFLETSKAFEFMYGWSEKMMGVGLIIAGIGGMVALIYFLVQAIIYEK